MANETMTYDITNVDATEVPASNYCRDYIRSRCTRDNCRFVHTIPAKPQLQVLFRFCHDYQNKGCFRANCKFIHATLREEEHFYLSGVFPRDSRDTRVCEAHLQGACYNKECIYVHLPHNTPDNDVIPMNLPAVPYGRPYIRPRDDDQPPESKLRRYNFEENSIDNQVLVSSNMCPNCEVMEHKVKLLHDNISVLLKKVKDLTEKNSQLTSMNEFLLGHTASIRSDQPCVITSRHGTSAPVSLATVSVTPVVSLAGALPALVPAATPNLALAPAVSRAQLLTPAQQILTVSTTQQLVGNSGALIVTSAGGQQLMQVSDSGTLMGGGQTVVAVPAQLTLAPPTLQGQLAPQHQAPQFAQQQHLAQQSAQHLAAQQSAQHLAAQQSAQQLAVQQSAQHLAQQSAQHLAQQSAQHLAQQSAQHLAQQTAQHLAQQSAHLAQQSAQHQHLAQQSAQHLAQQSAQHQHLAQQSAQHLAQQSQQLAQQSQQQLVPSAQQLVHQTSTQQITISSTSQPMALPNSQAQPITFPMISQSILPH